MKVTGEDGKQKPHFISLYLDINETKRLILKKLHICNTGNHLLFFFVNFIPNLQYFTKLT